MEKSKKNPHAGHRSKLKKRFLTQGLQGFEDHNVLELVLFFAIPRRDTNEIAHALLDKFGSLSRVFEAEVGELCSVDGIGEHAAQLIKTYPAVAKRYYQDRFKSGKKLPEYRQMGQDLVLHFAGLEHEQVYVVFYDSALRRVGDAVLHDGDINSVTFSFRKVCDVALQNNATFLVLAHNHPRGLPIASAEDLSTTGRLQDFLLQLDVMLIDHFIIGEEHFSSLQREVYYSRYMEMRQDGSQLPPSEFL